MGSAFSHGGSTRLHLESYDSYGRSTSFSFHCRLGSIFKKDSCCSKSIFHSPKTEERWIRQGRKLSSRKIPAAQKASFTALKQKSDGFVRAVNSLPESAPKLDFATYKSKIAVAGMVDDFAKKYEALEIPYPKDNVTASLDTLLATKKAEHVKFVADSEAKIGEIQVELEKWEKMRPIEEMNKEEVLAQMPHLAVTLGIRDPVAHKHSV